MMEKGIKFFRSVMNEIGFKIAIIENSSKMTVKKINGYRIFLHQKLGKGSYGTVYKGESDSKRTCAIKVIDKSSINSDPYLKAALISEIKIMKTLNSQNIVHFIEVMQSSNNYYIIQELCDGDLEHYLKYQPNRCLEEKKAIELLTQICNGFMTLVLEGIVHRDLKPANILMRDGKIKIGDFGFAKKNVSRRLKNQTAVGTPLYMPIELLKSQPYTSKCDIWAIGFIFYEMLHGQTPWTGRTQYELANSILKKPLKLYKQLSPATIDFLEKTLKPLEQNRISWDELFKHEIFNGYFKVYTDEHDKLENVYKKVMGELRFKIKSQNIHLQNLWEKLGYNQNKELNRTEFINFLRIIHPEMVTSQEQFFFEKMDMNGDGAISLKEVSAEFEKHSIPLESIFQENLPIFLKKFSSFEEQNDQVPAQKHSLNIETEKKIRSCFTRLYTIISKKNLTLHRVFITYDGDKSGELSLAEFSRIIKRLDGSFSEDEIEAVFSFIDADVSKTIEFPQLNSYYCKVNGLPEGFQVPKEYQLEQLQKRNNYHRQKKLEENR